MEKREYAFLVDIGKTMIDTNRISSEGKDSQRLYCKCGATKEIKNKIKRYVVKKHDTTVEDKHSVESVKCDKCSTVYSQNNKVFLLVPDEDEIFKINFYTEVKGGDIFLYREKYFANFNTSTDKLEDTIKRVDFIKFNKKTKKTTIFLDKPSLDKSLTQQKTTDNNNVNESVGLSKIQRLDHFFTYYDFAATSYFGLSNIFTFFNKIDEVVADLDQIKKLVPTISYTYNNREVIEEINPINGDVNSYTNENSGYGDGKKYKKPLNIGSYLARFVELSKVFICVADFQSITTILLTKKSTFFKDFIHSKNVLSSDIYTKHDATSPGKIIEISMNYDSNGSVKPAIDSRRINPNAEEGEDTNYLKVSPIIYKNIVSPSDLETLLSIYRKKFISKTDIETLFQNYETERLYKFYKSLDRERIDDSIPFSIKQIKHILDRNLDGAQEGQLQTNYIHLYTDTLRTMGLLELKENYIYNIKSNKELKDVHDDLAARYNAIKDAKKAEFYKKSVSEFKDLNTTIDDISFTVISTLENLNKEGMTMGHCVYTYLDKVIERNYLTVHVQHLISNERATLGLSRTNGGLNYDQLKGYQNSRATGEMIDAVIEFLKAKKIKQAGNSSDLSKSPGNQKRMHDYLSDKEVMEIRQKRAEKEQKAKKKAKVEEKEHVDSATATAKKKKGFLDNIFGD